MRRRRPFHPPPLPEVVVADPDGLADCLDHLDTVSVLGFDTEFIGEDSYRPELCLVQVATAERLYVIDPFGCGPLDEFWELMLDPDLTAVAHAGREEVRMCWFGSGRPPAKLFDVQIAAGLVGMTYPIGYAGLVQEVLGARTGKGETLTDWRRRPLSKAQIKYAFDDVRYLLPIWERLRGRLEELNRLDWAEEEFATFVKRAIADDPAVERWRRLKGSGSLSRRELAVVRAVFAWREDFAARLNRPPRVLLRDDLIVEIARRAPTTAEEVAPMRGVPRGETEAIATAVRSALALPEEEWPHAAEREHDPHHVGALSTFLGVLLADLCGRRHLASNLVANTADLKALVRARQPGGKPATDSSFASGWRASAIRPYLEAVLDGRVAVTVADPTAAAPLGVRPVRPSNPENSGG